MERYRRTGRVVLIRAAFLFPRAIPSLGLQSITDFGSTGFSLRGFDLWQAKNKRTQAEACATFGETYASI
jgi:hypothetical protein